MSIVDSSTAVTATSTGAVVTSAASTHTKGAWSEVIASTSEETHFLQITLKVTVGVADESFLIDIGVGAAASEVAVVNNIYFFTNTLTSIQFVIPVTIASGARVAIRCQDTSASAQTVEFGIKLSNDSIYGTSNTNVTLGALTASSKGTDVDPGGTNNTKGSYVEFTSSLSIDANYFVVLLGNSDNNAQLTQNILVDMATGAASSEVDVISNMVFSASSGEATSVAKSFYQTVASGTRISIRCQSSNTSDANDRIIDVVLLAFKVDAPPSGGGGIAHIVGQGGIVG